MIAAGPAARRGPRRRASPPTTSRCSSTLLILGIGDRWRCCSRPSYLRATGIGARRVLRARAVLARRACSGLVSSARADLALRGARDHVGRRSTRWRASAATGWRARRPRSSTSSPAPSRRRSSSTASRCCTASAGAPRSRASRLRSARERSGTGPLRGPRHGAAARRLRLQGRQRAVPHVGARRLRGRAHDGHGAHGGRRQGGGVRRVAARVRRGAAGAWPRTGSPRSPCWPSSRW